MPILTLSLSPRGALLPILIRLSDPDIRVLRAALRPIPQPITATGLIDTGADMTGVDAGLIQRLSPLTGGMTLANLPAHGGLSPAFQYNLGVTILHPSGNAQDNLPFRDMQVLELPLAQLGFEVLVGRDMLAHCNFLYQGPLGRFELSY